MKQTTAPPYVSILTTPEEFSYAETYSFLTRFSNECLHHAVNGSVEKMIKTSSGGVVVRLSEHPDGLEVSYPHQSPDPFQVEEVHGYIREWLGLNTDLKAFYAFAKKDVVLMPLVTDFAGLRIVGIPDLYEALAWAIIGQQINLTFAFTLKQRFVEAFGESVRIGDREYFYHPTAEKVAGLNADDFMPMQFNRKKAEYLIGTAGEIASGNLSRKILAEAEFGAAREKLIKIRGIGNWTANYVLMKCLHRQEALPLEDAGLLNALRKNYQLDHKPSFEEARMLTAHWGEFAALSTFYMWRSLAG